MCVLTVTLNPCIDRTYVVPGFALNAVHRPREMRVSAGGKGINVARVYRTLGGAVTATGFLGGANGEWLRQAMQGEGIPPEFVEIGGETRVCIAVVDPDARSQTEVNEIGPAVTTSECAALLRRVEQLLPGQKFLTVSGSLPPGAPPSLMREMVALAQERHGVRAVLDTSGDALAQGAEAQPYLLKPNVHELAALGIAAGDLRRAAREIQARFGAKVVLVTAGAEKVTLAHAGDLWEALPPRVSLASAVGSGDSLLAGFLWAHAQGYTIPESLQLGVGAGAANAEALGAGFFSRDAAFGWARETVVNKVTGNAV